MPTRSRSSNVNSVSPYEPQLPAAGPPPPHHDDAPFGAGMFARAVSPNINEISEISERSWLSRSMSKIDDSQNGTHDSSPVVSVPHRAATSLRRTSLVVLPANSVSARMSSHVDPGGGCSDESGMAEMNRLRPTDRCVDEPGPADRLGDEPTPAERLDCDEPRATDRGSVDETRATDEIGIVDEDATDRSTTQ